MLELRTSGLWEADRLLDGSKSSAFYLYFLAFGSYIVFSLFWTEGKNNLSISTQVRTQFFHTYLTCKTDLTPDELNAYTWTILLNNGVSWQTERNRIKMFGSSHLTARSYQRCQVNQFYLGQSFSTESIVIFNEIKCKLLDRVRWIHWSFRVSAHWQSNVSFLGSLTITLPCLWLLFGSTSQTKLMR